MKIFYSLLLLLAVSSTAYSQTLIKYGEHSVSADEFLRAYNKNKTPVTDKEKSLREYLALYTNFKLKVQEAKELKLDTLQQIQIDISNFRKQVEENYMSDEKATSMLIDEAAERSLKELHALYFSLPVQDSANPSDTLKAYKTMMSLSDELRGNTDPAFYKNFPSQKYPGVRANDIGFVTAFTLPYNFENIIYSLKPGEASRPYRTQSGWHVFKLVEERRSTGKWKVAQILFSMSPAATDGEKKLLQEKADSVYRLLINGAEFGAMTKLYSDDKITYMTGGELPEFSTGKYDPVFEAAVFGLKKDGEISKPFSTSFGYHIVKRLGNTPAPVDKNDLTLQFDTKQKVLGDSRIEEARNAFTKVITAKSGMKKTTDVKEADLLRYADSVMLNPVVENTSRFPISNKTIIKFNNGNLKGSDWLKFVVDYKGNFSDYKGETNKALWDKYLGYAANEYYKSNLEKYNEDFRYQMKEFREGNMLFEIMERNVWGFANTDTAGLLNHYQLHKQKYAWPPSASVLIFNCANEKSATDMAVQLKNDVDWRKLAEANMTSVQADSGRYELSQLLGNYTNVPVSNTLSDIIKNPDGSATVIKFIKVFPAGDQRTFEEAKGLVINDYQNVLEERWLASLRKKYPVTISESTVQTIMSRLN